MKIQPTFIDLMRHGEPEGSCSKGGTILRGSTDSALTEKGWLQAKARCQSIIELQQGNSKSNGSPWDIIISSPLIRCSDFSKQLHKELFSSANESSASLLINEQWREVHYGDWDGKSTADIWQQQPELMAKMWKNPLEFCAPNGESVKHFSERLASAWVDLLQQYQGKRVLVVCHGGVMRVLLQQLLMMSPEGMNRFAIPYAAMTRFRVDHSLVENSETVNSELEGSEIASSEIESSEAENPTLTHINHWPSLLNHYSNDLV